MAKAVAEKMKTEKGEGGGPAWVSDGLGWVPRKFGEMKAFFADVRNELKKVTWPSKKEVYATTVVVIATSIFFGFYLWLLDLVMSWVYTNTIDKL